MSPFRRKRKRSCLGCLFRLVVKLIVYGCILLLLHQYWTNHAFQQNVNAKINGFISSARSCFSTLKEHIHFDFSIEDLWASVQEMLNPDEKETAAVLTSTPRVTQYIASTSTPRVTQYIAPTPTPFSILDVGKTGGNSVCSSREGLIDELKKQLNAGSSSISVPLSLLLYQNCGDTAWMTEALYDAGIQSASWIRREYAGKYSITFNEITRMNAQTCATLTQFEALLKGAQNKDSIAIRPSADLYAQLRKDDWALLYKTEGKLGITAGDFTYYEEPYRVLTFSNLVYAQHFYPVSSLAQAKLVLSAGAERCISSIALYCDSDELFHQLTNAKTAFGTSNIQAVADNCGISSPNFRFSEHRQLIYSTELEYFPGARIVSLARNGMLNKLTAQERALYDRAMQIVNRSKSMSADDYELVMNICTELASISRYQLCEDKNCANGCELDNAYGVLMRGIGECDSYTDAFYLIANLAGLDVHYQIGDSHEQFSSMTSDSTHIWNTVTLGENTYFLDMTWIDSDQDTHTLDLCWMLIGRDRAQYSHIWDDHTALKSIAPATSRQYFPYYRQGNAFASTTDAQNYVRNQKKLNFPFASLMLTASNGASSQDDLVQQIISGLRFGGSYSHRSIGNSIFFTYYFQ